jgi:hypothetical protein
MKRRKKIGIMLGRINKTLKKIKKLKEIIEKIKIKM